MCMVQRSPAALVERILLQALRNSGDAATVGVTEVPAAVPPVPFARKEHAMGKHHDKGQRDGSNNVYDPPVPISPLDELIHSSKNLDDWRELNDDYDKGWSNGRNQR